MVCRLNQTRKSVEPCSIVIFGASGDLTARKLIPAFYHLLQGHEMPPPSASSGLPAARNPPSPFARKLRQALDQFSRTKPVDDKVWAEFSANIFYCQGEFSDPQAYKKLEQQLSSFGNEKLRKHSPVSSTLPSPPASLARWSRCCTTPAFLHKEQELGWQRIVVEKPFGHDLESAIHLNGETHPPCPRAAGVSH